MASGGDSNGKKDGGKLGAKLNVTEITFSTVAGFCTGYAMKVVGRGSAVVLGVGFMGLQGLQYAEVIKIDWDKINSKVTKVFDVDGDKKVDVKDLQAIMSRTEKFLSRGLPDIAGFGIGFYTGMRFG